MDCFCVKNERAHGYGYGLDMLNPSKPAPLPSLVNWIQVDPRCGVLRLLRFPNILYCFIFNENHISAYHGLLLDWISQSVSKFITWTAEIDALLRLAIKFGSRIPRDVHECLATKDLQLLV